MKWRITFAKGFLSVTFTLINFQLTINLDYPRNSPKWKMIFTHPLSSAVDVTSRPRDPQRVLIAPGASDKALRPEEEEDTSPCNHVFPMLLSPSVMVVCINPAPESLGNPQSELHPLRVTGLAHWKEKTYNKILVANDQKGSFPFTL